MINRKSRQFSDLNLFFTKHPVTADVTKKFDEEAIKASVRNLISTKHYERPFHPEIGCQIYSLLFDNFNIVSTQVMQRTIRNTLEKFEPRVDIIKVNIRDNRDNNEILVDLIFFIKGSERPVTLQTAISRIR